jgi:putative endonuclease
MFSVYIIFSASIDQYYVGHTQNLEERLFRHNNSGSKATKKAADWTLKYTQPFDSRSEAMKHEIEIKAKKSRKFIESLITKGP